MRRTRPTRQANPIRLPGPIRGGDRRAGGTRAATRIKTWVALLALAATVAATPAGARTDRPARADLVTSASVETAAAVGTATAVDAARRPSRPTRRPARVTAWPPPGAVGVRPDRPLLVEVQRTRLRAVVVTGPDGRPVAGRLDPERRWWIAAAPLAPDTLHRVRVRLGTGPAPRVRTWTFRTLHPTRVLTARVTPGDDDVVGVGQPIILRFNHPVTQRAAVERRLRVWSDPPVPGAWGWISDTEVHWRPRDPWPAGTRVWMDADLRGVHAGEGLWGGVHRTVAFRIGDAHLSIADAATHTLTVTENGRVVARFPMSAGRPDYPTMSGVHLVLWKTPSVVMDSRTIGIPLDHPDGYLQTVHWDVAISTTGEYVHAAPWSVRHQGRANVSHGCINLSTADARWFYEWSRRGDLVVVTNTPRPPNRDPAMVDWNVTWDEWRRTSALYRPAAPKVRRF